MYSTRALNVSGAKSPVGTPTGAKSPKSKKVKTYNYSSDNAEDSWKTKLKLSTKKKKDTQTTPWRTPPPTAPNQPFGLQFKSNKVDWNTVKNEQSYWSDDFNESDYSSGVVTVRKRLQMSPNSCLTGFYFREHVPSQVERTTMTWTIQSQWTSSNLYLFVLLKIIN